MRIGLLELGMVLAMFAGHFVGQLLDARALRTHEHVVSAVDVLDQVSQRQRTEIRRGRARRCLLHLAHYFIDR